MRMDSGSTSSSASESDAAETADEVSTLLGTSALEVTETESIPVSARKVLVHQDGERAKKPESVKFADNEATIVPPPVRRGDWSEDEEYYEDVAHEIEIETSELSEDTLAMRRRARMALRRRNRASGSTEGASAGTVTVVATADSYKMKELRKYFQPADIPSLFNDVVLLHLPAYGGEEETVVFFFSYGVTVCWGSERVGQKVLKQMKTFEIKSEANVECELYTYSYRFGDGTRPKGQAVRGDHFYLENQTLELKLAIGSALAQSLKLMVLESRIEQVISQTDKYPSILFQEGVVRLALQETARLKGHLFLHRMTVNLHSDILDTPDFFWEHSDLKPVYQEVRSYMEIDRRVEILNKRLMIVDEMFAVLHTVQHGNHAVKLELIVLGVIFVNVLFAVCFLWKQYSWLFVGLI